MKRVILIIFIVVIAAFLGVWKFVFKKAETSVKSKKADMEVTASELVNAFESDEESANLQYFNKVVLVRGTISEIKSDETGNFIYLKEPESLSGVLCGFDKSIDLPEKIQSGDEVAIKGVCTGYLMDVVLNKCVIEK